MQKLLFGREIDVFNESCCSTSSKRTLYVETTTSCNARCNFCKQYEKPGYRLDLQKLRFVIEELVRGDIIDRISLTGGEPLLLDQFPELLDLLDGTIANVGYYALTTNGSLLAKHLDLIERSRLEYLNISRHSTSDAENDRLMGARMPSCEELKQLFAQTSKSTRLNATLTDALLSRDAILEYIGMARYLGVGHILFRQNYWDSRPLPEGLFLLPPTLHKESNKCACDIVHIEGVEVELRRVDVNKELDVERKHQMIRNLVFAGNELRGGWSSQSLLLYK